MFTLHSKISVLEVFSHVFNFINLITSMESKLCGCWYVWRVNYRQKGRELWVPSVCGGLNFTCGVEIWLTAE